VKISSPKKQQFCVKPFNSAKAELQSLQFEKSLVDEAITKVYEAVQEGRIDSVDRDRLLMKYKHQLDSYNEKIAALQSAVDFVDLKEMRNDIVSLLERRITAIDQKLVELSKKSETPFTDVYESMKQKQQKQQQAFIERKRDIENENRGGEAVADVEGIAEEVDKSKGENIEELQKEIIEALSRLEQVEIDDNEPPSKSQNNRTPISFNDKSCLRQFR
jgi:DNA repair ATPase RecN